MPLTTNFALRKPAGTDAADVEIITGNLADDADAALLAVKNAAPAGIIARGKRITTSSSTTSEIGVLRLDNIALLAGRSYKIWTSPLIIESTVANDTAAATVRVSNSGIATVASTLLDEIQTTIPSIVHPPVLPLDCEPYIPATNETLSVLLSVARLSGTGNVSLVTNTGIPITMVVEDMGVDPGDTGVDL